MPAALKLFRFSLLAALSAVVLYGAFATAHWPLVGDAPLMHYVVFLLEQGKAPYREVLDVNLPGTYFLQWTAIHLLGPGAAGWRVFDFLLCLTILLAGVAIAKPRDWMAGAFAGAVFFTLHLRDGLIHTGQRDLMMTALLLVSCACYLLAARSGSVWMLGVAALPGSMAATIKPTALGANLLFALIAIAAMRKQQRLRPAHLLSAMAGMALPLLAMVLYLVREQALGSFWQTMTGVVALHNSLGREPLASLLAGIVPSTLLALTLLALPAMWTTRPWQRVEGQLLLAGILFGAFSFVFQGKAFPYHRYPFDVFLLLLIAMAVAEAAFQSRSALPRYTAIAVLVLGSLYITPSSVAIASHFDWRHDEFDTRLSSDLQQLGGAALNHQVQCIDMTAGCLNTLYRMRLVQSTGTLYDCYLFRPEQNQITLQLRERFWKEWVAARPKVVVVSNQQCFTNERTFRQIHLWPQFEASLASDYTELKEELPTLPVRWWRTPAEPFGYRIYLRKQ